MNNKKTIICSEYQKERIYHALSAGNQAVSLVGTELLSPGALLHSDSEEDKYASMMLFARRLKDISGSLSVYRDMVKFPAFISEILSFARECALFGITEKMLPRDTESEEELALILAEALKMPLEEQFVFRNYDELVRKAIDKKSEFSILFETDIFRRRFLDTVMSAAGCTASIGTAIPAETEHLRYALSTRQEIEAAAQEICRNEKPCNIILTDRKAQLPVLEQVFERYGIPFCPIEEQAYPQAVLIYISLAEFAVQKDAESLIQIMRTDGFSKKAGSELIPFAQRILTDISIDTGMYELIRQPDFQNEADKTRNLYNMFADYLDSVQDEIDILLSAEDPASALRYAYTLLQKHPRMNDSAQLKAGTAIRTILSQTLAYVHNEEDADLVLSMISNVRAASGTLTTDFCTITDLTHPVDAKEVTYILGCSARSYPGIPVRKGLFDEIYTAKISAFPSLEERHESYMKQLSWIRSSGRTLIWSYATNDYQGRNIEPAFEITNRLGSTGVPWKPDSLKPARTPRHALDEDTAKELFLKEDGKVHGSISRFERWFQCPYSYFIESGLSVRRFDTPSLDSATIGTIQHAFMETMVNSYGKDYASVTEQEIREFLKPWFEDLKVMNPHDVWQIDLTMERMSKGLLRSLMFLTEAEKNTIYRPLEPEKEFNYDITDGIHLKGIIDRVDISGDSFRIIDYKSSVHKLSESSIKAGIQLQLLSYVFAAEHKLRKSPSGACYFSMQSKSASEKAASFKTKGIVLEEDLTDETYLKDLSDAERRFSGWTFANDETDANFKQYFSMPLYDLEKVRQCIKELYEYFRDHLLAGEIQVDPLDSACMFCLNAPVCRNTNGTRKASPVVMADEKLKVGKGDAS